MRYLGILTLAVLLGCATSKLVKQESNPDYVGRLMSECNRFRHDFEMRRKVMPLALKGESRSRDAAKGGSTSRKTVDAWHDAARPLIERMIAAGETNDSYIAAVITRNNSHRENETRRDPETV